MKKDFSAMSTDEINNRITELTAILNMGMGKDWDEAYSEYTTLTAILDERFRTESQADFDAFYEKNIKGKRWEEIDPENWDFYSDWHKDMYGFRPRHT